MVLRSRIWSKALAAVVFFVVACYMDGFVAASMGAAAWGLMIRAVEDFQIWNPRR